MNYDDEQYICFNVSTTSSSVYPVGSNSNRPQIMSFLGPLGYSHKICRMERWRSQHSSSSSSSTLRCNATSLNHRESPVCMCLVEDLVISHSSSLLRWALIISFSQSWTFRLDLPRRRSGITFSSSPPRWTPDQSFQSWIIRVHLYHWSSFSNSLCWIIRVSLHRWSSADNPRVPASLGVLGVVDGVYRSWDHSIRTL